jgi:hypothetical protein
MMADHFNNLEGIDVDNRFGGVQFTLRYFEGQFQWSIYESNIDRLKTLLKQI